MSFGHVLGGALQGIGAGLMQGEIEKARARRERALAAAKAKRIEVLGPGERVVDLPTGKVIAEGMAKEPDMPGIADELVAAGYKPGTPAFQQAITSVINGKYGSDYVDEAGNVRRRSVLNLTQPPAPQQPSQGGQNGAFTFEMYRGAVNGLGQQGANDWLARQGIVVSVATPAEARRLPSGTRIKLPDGREGRVP